MSITRLALVSLSIVSLAGCGRPDRSAGVNVAKSASEGARPTSGQDDMGTAEDEAANIRTWESVAELPGELAVFRTVFWAPEDTISLRAWLRKPGHVKGKRVLEIGTGSGLIALCCLRAGAEHVVATDVNPEALANASFNAERLNLETRLETRLVSPTDSGAYRVIGAEERFDLIVSNPPWEDATPARVEEAAFFDPHFRLLETLIGEGKSHLRPGGRILLAYGCRTAVERARQLAEQHGYTFHQRDERPVEILPEVFVPGMLLELIPRDDG